MALLELRARRTGERPLERDGHALLQGEREWILSGPSDLLNAAASMLGSTAEKLNDTNILLSFGNAVGFIDIPGYGRVEVVSGKWTDSHFNRMLAELSEIASGLPFASDATAALPYDRSVASRGDVLYHMFVYLRYILSQDCPLDQQLLPALRLVLQNPHRQFKNIRRDVPLDAVRQFDPGGLTRIATGQARLYSVSHTATLASLPLARVLKGHMPERVTERSVEHTYDTAENRFVKTFLQSINGIIDGMHHALQQEPVRNAFANRIRNDCREMASLLRPIEQDELWDAVGAMVHLPASSPVLHGRRGYREIYRHFARLRLAARIPLSREVVHDLLEAKDIAQLYELWTFFALARELERLIGKPKRSSRPQVSSTEVSIPWDFQVEWEGGIRLQYNPRFSRSRQAMRHSYSVPLRPDIALSLPGGPNQGLHLFDAKFRVERLGEVLGADDFEDEPGSLIREERQGTFKRGDLYKMHTYKDAIRQTRSVWILYPGTEGRFFSVEGSTGVLPGATLPAVLDGVGAIPLTPLEQQQPVLRQVLCRMLDIG